MEAAFTNVPCPQCGANLRFPTEKLGKTGRCPKCKALVPTSAPAAEAAYEEIEPEGAAARAADEVAPFRVAAPADALAAGPPPDVPARPEDPDRVRKRKKRKKGGGEGYSRATVARVRAAVIVLAILAVLSIPVGAIFLAMYVPPPDVIAAEKWQPVEVPQRVKVLLPGPAARQEQNAGGIRMVMYLSEPDKSQGYGVGYSEGTMPEHRRALPAETILNDACTGAVANVPSALEVSRTPVQLGNIPGMEVVAKVPSLDGKMIVRGYYLAGSSRLFLAIAGGRGLQPGHENVKRLFESFQILDDGVAPPAPAPAQPPAVTPPGKAPEVAQKPQGPPGGAHAVIELPGQAEVARLGYSADGMALAVATRAERALWCSVTDPKQLVTTPGRPKTAGGNFSGAAVSPQGDKVAFYRHGHQLFYVHAAEPNSEVVLQPDGGAGISQWKAAFDPTGKYLCTTHGDQLVRLWDLETKKLLQALPGHTDQVTSAAFSPDGALLATAELKGILWDAKTYKEVARFSGAPQFAVSELAFSPDGKYLAGYSDRTLLVWPLAVDGERPVAVGEPQLIHHLGRIQALTISPDGAAVVTATDDGFLRFWDPQTQKKRDEIALEAAGAATALAYRANDGQLAVGCRNRVLLYNLKARNQE